MKVFSCSFAVWITSIFSFISDDMMQISSLPFKLRSLAEFVLLFRYKKNSLSPPFTLSIPEMIFLPTKNETKTSKSIKQASKITIETAKLPASLISCKALSFISFNK